MWVPAGGFLFIRLLEASSFSPVVHMWEERLSHACSQTPTPCVCLCVCLSLSLSGVSCDDHGYVVVNSNDQTSCDNIFAIGDCAQVECFLLGWLGDMRRTRRRGCDSLLLFLLCFCVHRVFRS